jgi:hypothetical protein
MRGKSLSGKWRIRGKAILEWNTNTQMRTLVRVEVASMS